VHSQPADLYVLPELFNTGYLFRDRKELTALAEAYPLGPTCLALTALSGETNAVIAAGFAEKTRDGRLYNSAALFDCGRPIGCYRKLHLFDSEFLIFDPGDLPPRVIASSRGRLGPMVCFDWFFPEMARCLALEGAQILVHMANLVLPHCQDAMATRCLENRVFAITANRIGTEARHGRTLRFTGGSQITGVKGERLAQAAPDREEVIVVAIDPALADDKAVTPRNHIVGDRRPGMYKRITE
jgi:predicted amidohydrolase